MASDRDTVGQYDQQSWRAAIQSMYPDAEILDDVGGSIARVDGRQVSTYDNQSGRVTTNDQKASDFFGNVNLGPEARLKSWQKQVKRDFPGVSFRDGPDQVLAVSDGAIVRRFSKREGEGILPN
jgi:hypothetical protein